MTKYLTKLNTLMQELQVPEISHQVKEINQIVTAVAEKKVIANQPARLGLLPDEAAELEKQLTPAKQKQLKVVDHLLNSVRQYLSLKYGIWSLPNMQTANLIQKELNVESALEIMAGNAYWSMALHETGIKAVATDSLEWAKTSATGRETFFPVEDLEAAAAIKKYAGADLILCSWSPNFGHSDLDVVDCWRKYSPQSYLLFIGERDGATNTPEFWQEMQFKHSPAIRKINQSFVSYDFIEEKIYEID
ncbi:MULTISPECIES: SAM-dependent methyltransferase [Lactobacillus]|uniref:SAM-dependent methyltransferase n=1 Tax=Lactobacillus xujianguonis TaxID=2495899 RepID=A0A437SXX0_9LACO|nr:MULTISPECIES: SAM-dependent methyltransferase [Lactobacillus]RVU71720.1 SAM-dependent methyltransferase [Lactobacillus xujianguonis]RVU77550.1 SAM-dependent methyltransferase [Lactobacillus xujianguonis]